MKVDVAFLPMEIDKPELAEMACIVLDIFRATTSIVTAMANGCQAIVPVLTIEDACDMADRFEAAQCAGERQSIKIEGFDFGNSPLEFLPERVKGQTIIMTTTNGTMAIKSTGEAYLTLIGSFLNAETVCRQAGIHDRDILIVCAGTERLFSLEDALCAGLLVKILQTGRNARLTDTARGALAMYNGAANSLLEIAGESRNGRRLKDIGKQADVEYCLRLNTLDIAPRYRMGRIELLY